MNQFKQLNVKYHGKLFLQCYLARPNANVFVIIAALKRFIQFSRKLKFNLISVPWVTYVYTKLERSFVRVDIKEMHR